MLMEHEGGGQGCLEAIDCMCAYLAGPPQPHTFDDDDDGGEQLQLRLEAACTDCC